MFLVALCCPTALHSFVNRSDFDAVCGPTTSTGCDPYARQSSTFVQLQCAPHCLFMHFLRKHSPTIDPISQITATENLVCYLSCLFPNWTHISYLVSSILSLSSILVPPFRPSVEIDSIHRPPFPVADGSMMAPLHTQLDRHYLISPPSLAPDTHPLSISTPSFSSADWHPLV